MEYEVIRVSADYGMLVVWPFGAEQATNELFWIHNDCENQSTYPDGAYFREASRIDAIGYFSGQADGMGWGDMPELNRFASLDDVRKWAEQRAAAEKHLASIGCVLVVLARTEGDETVRIFTEELADEDDPEDPGIFMAALAVLEEAAKGRNGLAIGMSLLGADQSCGAEWTTLEADDIRRRLGTLMAGCPLARHQRFAARLSAASL